MLPGFIEDDLHPSTLVQIGLTCLEIRNGRVANGQDKQDHIRSEN